MVDERVVEIVVEANNVEQFYSCSEEGQLAEPLVPENEGV